MGGGSWNLFHTYTVGSSREITNIEKQTRVLLEVNTGGHLHELGAENDIPNKAKATDYKEKN